MSSPIEVEFKFPVEDLASLRSSLVAMGAQPVKVSEQVDEYFNDPLRDFAKLDVALRIRQSDSKLWLTYKGPNLDPTAKIRTEIETPLVDEAAADQIKQTFIGIGFFSVARVAKQRETMSLDWEGQQVEICLDTVAEVGEFVELELVVNSVAEQNTAKQALESLARRDLIGRTKNEGRSSVGRPRKRSRPLDELLPESVLLLQFKNRLDF